MPVHQSRRRLWLRGGIFSHLDNDGLGTRIFASELRRGDRVYATFPAAVMSDYPHDSGELVRRRTLPVEIWLHAGALT